MVRGRLLVVGSFLSLFGVCAAVACGGSSTGAAIPGDDGGNAEATTGTDGAGGTDGGDNTITDGGSNIDPDGGTNVDDAGLDAGRCNAIDNAGAAVTSTCTSVPPTPTGGALVAGKYNLVSVTDLGSVGFCKSTFIPIGFRGSIDLTVTGTTATMETVTDIAPSTRERRTLSLTTTATNTSPLTAAETCPTTGAPGNVFYSSSVQGGKQTLALVLPYGKGTALYTYAQ